MQENDKLKISCIVNPRSARNKWQRRKKLRSFLLKNLPGETIDIQGGKRDTIETTKKKCIHHDIIVAVGGDGTVADVIQGIVESGRGKEIFLGLIPFGSGNAFRKSLHIPKYVKKALNVLKKGNIITIDLIDVDGKAATFVSVGATAKVTQEKLQHKAQGLLGHLLASRIMFTLPSNDLEIELIEGTNNAGECFESKVLHLKAFDCIIGKTNHFGYNWKIAPKAMIDDGFLDITFFEITGLKYFLYFPLIYFGIFQKRQKHFKARKMTIKGQHLPVQYNGEFLGVKDEIELEVLPQALNVLSPKVGKREGSRLNI